MRHRARLRPLVVLGAALPLLLAGCSAGASESGPSTRVTAVAGSKAAALVPAAVKQRGSITVVTDVTYPPFGFLEKDGKTFAGIDIDTARALEPVLGVEVKVVNAGFDAFIPGLQAGRYDAGFNAISDTPDRRKVVDFIDYNEYGGLFLTKPDSALRFTDMSVACGVTVGAEKGGDTVEFLRRTSQQCEKDGKKAVGLTVFDSQSAALVALTSGRVQAVLSGSTAGYLADRSGGQYVVNGTLQSTLNGKFDVGGMALPEGSSMTKAMLAAVTQLYDDGTLKSIYARYGIRDDILIAPKLNAG